MNETISISTLLTTQNVSFVIASAFVACIIAGVFQMAKTIEKMGDDYK